MDSNFARQLADARVNAVHVEQPYIDNQLMMIADEMGVKLNFTDCTDLRIQLENALLAHELSEARQLMVAKKLKKIPYHVTKKNVVFGCGCQ